MNKRAGVIGSGIVGETLANGLLDSGYEVCRGSRDPEQLAVWLAEAGEGASVGTQQDAACFGDLVVLAVRGAVAEDVVSEYAEELSGSVVIDATNPIGGARPQDGGQPKDGVLSFFTGPNESLMERLQAAAPDARFVKAFNSVGAAFMVNPQFDEAPTMFICGDDTDAKSVVGDLLDDWGWDVADMGTATAARAIEPLCILWCIPGLRDNEWTHAFRLLRL